MCVHARVSVFSHSHTSACPLAGTRTSFVIVSDCLQAESNPIGLQATLFHQKMADSNESGERALILYEKQFYILRNPQNYEEYLIRR